MHDQGGCVLREDDVERVPHPRIQPRRIRCGVSRIGRGGIRLLARIVRRIDCGNLDDQRVAAVLQCDRVRFDLAWFGVAGSVDDP